MMEPDTPADGAPSEALKAMAEAENFHLTPKFDARLFVAGDPRVMDPGVVVRLDGEPVKHVVRAYVGDDGWVDLYPTDADSKIITAPAGDTFAVERRHGRVRIELPDGTVHE